MRECSSHVVGVWPLAGSVVRIQGNRGDVPGNGVPGVGEADLAFVTLVEGDGPQIGPSTAHFPHQRLDAVTALLLRSGVVPETRCRGERVVHDPQDVGGLEAVQGP